MQILQIYNIKQVQNQSSKPVYSGSFRGVSPSRISVGTVKHDTKVLFSDIMHAYREIQAVLEKKTEEGIHHLAKIYPNVTIRDNLVFHNCGEDNSSISIRAAESSKYNGLTHLSRRVLNRSTGRYKTVEAFMFDGNERLIKDFNPSYSNRFPEVRTYLTSEEIEEKKLDESIVHLLEDLDLAMLKFRQILAKNEKNYLKPPDGKIPYIVGHDMRYALKICDEITKKGNKLPPKVLLSINKNFPEYLSISGLKTYAFKDLGDEKVTINFASLEKDGEEFKRLSVYDSENKPVKTFLIKNDEKFISNIAQEYPTNFPRKFVYANEEELEKEYLPEFLKYFNLYLDKLKEYKKTIDSNYDKYFYKDVDGEINDNLRDLLGEALEWYDIAKIKLRKLPPAKAAQIKADVAEMQLDSGAKGAWFRGFEGGKVVNLLPIESKKHSGLCRLTIIDNETNETKMYLIKDLKYIVKNFNPKYPQVLPNILTFINETEMQELNLEGCARFLKMKTEKLAAVADEAFEKRFTQTRVLKERNPREKDFFKSKEYKQVLKECKKQFDEALKNLHLGMENFNASLQSIQEKITEIYPKKENL